ncbi:hypothetical protein GGD38_003863 [Chitinophagaceae bacterium OAS944]|nr:hypothetical protein [Chitinophagaceae bacterium OAS944]
MQTLLQIFRDAVNKICPIGEDDWLLCEPGLSLKTLDKSAFFVDYIILYSRLPILL